MSNALASTKNIPQHLLALYSEQGDYRSDFGELKPSDFGVSFLKLVMDKTRWTKPNWGGNGEQPLPLSTMVLSRDNVVVPPKTKFIPLLRRSTYIKWVGKPGEGKMEFATTDPNDKRILACNGLEFLEDPRNPGKKQAPLVTEYVNFYVWTNLTVNGAPMEEPVILSFYRTSIKAGRKLIQDILRATKGGRMPMYTCVFELQNPTIVRDGMQEWPQFAFTGAGFIPDGPDGFLPKVQKMHEMAEMFSQTASLTEEATELEDVGSAPQVVQNATPFVPQSAPVQQPVLQQRQMTLNPSSVVVQSESPIPAAPANVAPVGLF